MVALAMLGQSPDHMRHEQQLQGLNWTVQERLKREGIRGNRCRMLQAGADIHAI